MGNSGSTIFPVYVLGKTYEEKHTHELQRHAESFFRFTYRRGFPELAPSTLTSDGGWGCMLRSAQMLMGHALARHYLGTEWRMPPNVQPSRVRKSRIQALSQNEIYCEITRWFTDYPGWPHIYSLHHLVHCGTYRYGKPAGQWVGPSTAAYMLRDLARLHCALFGGTVEILVTQGDCIYRSEAELVATRTLESRADYVHSLRQQHQLQVKRHQEEEREQQQYRVHSMDVNSTNDTQRVFSGDWQNPVTAIPSSSNPVIPLHPLLVPLSSAGSSNITHVYDSEVDGILLHSPVEEMPINETTRHNDNIDMCKVQTTSTTIDTTMATENHPSILKSERTSESKNEFFDPLLRPPPKVQTPWTAALMVLVPLMLGISTVNTEYIEGVKEVLRHKHCIGIIGGSPNHAIYFVGYRGDLLLGLDPHTVFANPPVPPPRTSNTATSDIYSVPFPPAVSLNPVSTTSTADTSHPSSRGIKRQPTTRFSESSDYEDRTHHTNKTNTFDTAHTHYSSHTTNTNTAQYRPDLGLNSAYNTTTTNDAFFNMFGATFASIHSTTSTPSSTYPTADYLHQVHVSEFVTLDIHRLDPSLAIGFYFANRAEFDAFCEDTKIQVARKLREGKYPLYTVQDLAPTFMYSGEGEGEVDRESSEEEEADLDTTDYFAQVNDSDDTMKCEVSGNDPMQISDSNVNKPVSGDKKITFSIRRHSSRHNKGNRGRNVIPDPVPDDPDDEEYVLV